MRFTTYTKYKGKWLDALNLESLLEHLSDFLMDGGFAGGPHYHPYWGWSGDEDVNSTDALKRALLKALLESGQLTPEMIEELRGEGQGDDAVREEIAKLLDDLVERMAEEGFINLETGNPQMPGATYDVTGQGKIDEAKQAADLVNAARIGKQQLEHRYSSRRCREQREKQMSTCEGPLFANRKSQVQQGEREEDADHHPPHEVEPVDRK